MTLTAIPADACQEFTGWSGDASGNTNPLVIVMDVEQEHHGDLRLKTFTITASAGPGGSITPSGAVSVNCGTDQTFTITPACLLPDRGRAGGRRLGRARSTSYTFTERADGPYDRGDLRPDDLHHRGLGRSGRVDQPRAVR